MLSNAAIGLRGKRFASTIAPCTSLIARSCSTATAAAGTVATLPSISSFVSIA
jgi:hypothetical protein